MKNSIKKGFGFGLTSGIITTLGLIIGLHAGTNSGLAVISGILVIAVADALSDAFGIHISEESEEKHSAKEIWESTVTTFIAKFVFALTFLVPVIFLPLSAAIIACIIWGLLLIAAFSYYIAFEQKIGPARVIAEHLAIAVAVVIMTHYLGEAIAVFGG
jgi:VIT1/CCC1 family predicted Fe2+/Mn2+ transporter